MRSRLRNQRNGFFIVLVIAIVVVAVLGVAFSRPLFSFTSSVASWFSVAPVDEYALLPKRILASRLSDTERELASVRYQAALYTTFLEENQRLNKELGLRVPNESGIGRVIRRPPQTHYDTLIVSLENNHAVSMGDLAFFENILLGVVEDTSPSAAKVVLFSSPGTTLDVRAGNPSAIAVAHGLGGGAFVFDIPNAVELRAGDTVVSASHDAHVIGVVLSVTPDPDRTTKRVHAHSAAALSDVRFVHFVTPAFVSEETL